MVRLARVSLAGTGIVLGGIGLGTLLSGFVQPVPIEAPAAPWEGQLHPQIVRGSQDDTAAAYYGSWPEDLTPRYDNAALTWVEPDWLTEARSEAEAPVEEDLAPLPAVEYVDLADRTVTIPHYRQLEDAAAPAPASGVDDDTSVDPNADPANLIVPIDTARPPPLPAGGAKTIHIAAEDG